MAQRISPCDERALFERGFSRRQFGRIAALLGAGASLPFYGEAALAQLSQVKDIPADAVRINANENPLGPAPEALEALLRVVKDGGRYRYDLTDEFRDTLAAGEGLSPDHVQPFAGSSAPLTQAVVAFTSPSRSFVTCDPGYEAGERTAKFIGAKVVRVPLTKTYAHDVRAMAAADANAGLIYVCNPNNPTGTLTPDEDLDWLVDNMPQGAVLLLDEAYTHIAGARLRSDLVQKGKDVVILRTFSKIYGMAGLRAGAAIARPELLEKITVFSSGAMPITGMAAATASLRA
jgi:histidinol-phosphate aminotransferase